MQSTTLGTGDPGTGDPGTGDPGMCPLFLDQVVSLSLGFTGPESKQQRQEPKGRQNEQIFMLKKSASSQVAI